MLFDQFISIYLSLFFLWEYYFLFMPTFSWTQPGRKQGLSALCSQLTWSRSVSHQWNQVL
jgi:hypothetical protein